MISIKSDYEIGLLRIAGKIVYQTHQYLKPFIKEGITTQELDKLAEDFIRSKGATPSCKGYHGYPATLCTSINDEVVHGIPSKRKLKNGDIITLDICACYKGYHGDSAWTYKVGEVSDEVSRLMKGTEESLFAGLSVIKPGMRIGDISNAVETVANKYGFGVVHELCGHGVGHELHEDPNIPNYGKAGVGPVIKENMVFAVEPMLTLGKRYVWQLEDGWTIVTQDGSPSAHFEHTILVTKDGYEILTTGE